MYVPAVFKEENPEILHAFMKKYSFAVLYTTGEGGPMGSHIPLLFEADSSPHGCLIGHVARPNLQWKHFGKGTEAMAVFQGPHAYISPSWYQEKLAVPTWNYMAVHAYGTPEIIEQRKNVFEVLQKTTEIYEGHFEKPWDMPLPAEFLDKLMTGIVAFKIPISRLEGKFKLSQNRSEADRRGAIAELEKGSPMQVELAQEMKIFKRSEAL